MGQLIKLSPSDTSLKQPGVGFFPECLLVMMMMSSGYNTYWRAWSGKQEYNNKKKKKNNKNNNKNKNKNKNNKNKNNNNNNNNKKQSL